MITDISRDWGVSPSIVRITTTDGLQAITTTGYLLTQKAVIEELNKGQFEWLDSDMILIDYDGGEGFFTRDADDNKFVAEPSTASLQYVSVPVTAAELNGAYAAPFELIEAQGPNTVIRVADVTIEVNYGSAQFANGGNVALQYDDTANGAGVLASAALPSATVTGWNADAVVGLAGALANGAAAAIVDKGIFLSNLTAAFTVGTDAVLTFHIAYSVLTTSL